MIRISALTRSKIEGAHDLWTCGLLPDLDKKPALTFFRFLPSPVLEDFGVTGNRPVKNAPKYTISTIDSYVWKPTIKLGV